MRMKNKDILKIGAIIFLVFALVWVFRWILNGNDDAQSNNGSNGVEAQIQASEAFRDLDIENLDGESTTLEAHEGSPVLLTFWEQEDEESQEQLAILDNLLLLLEGEVAFLSVFEPEDREVPYTAVIDQQGTVFQEYSELVTEEVLLSDVEELLERDEP
jgi:hypothetical protein